MDNMKYWYYGFDAGGNKIEYYPTLPLPSSIEPTNQLSRVEDFKGAVSTFGDLTTQSPFNYDYDQIGNLVKDADEKIDLIEWTVYGKIKATTKQDGSVIRYSYDPSGNRIAKNVGDAQTMYVRDAQGNTMAIYEKPSGSTNWTLSELQLYGSSRLGTYKPNVTASTIGINTGVGHDSYLAGTREYELSNHLGNVLVTVSDKKIGHSSNGTIDYYEADVVSAQDYYPFGMMMKERALNSSGRYAFNGKEQDTKVSGEGNQYDYGFRIYDQRLVRFKSVDPLQKKYSDLTPYQFASNSPIWAADVDGLEARIKTIYTDNKGKAQVSIKNASDHSWEEWKQEKRAMFSGFGWTDKTLGFDWTTGYDYYNYNRLKADNASGYNGPNSGTLTIDSRGKVAKLSFEYQTGKNAPKGPKYPTLGESIKMGGKGFKMIYNDEGVTEVRNNVLTGFSLILGVGELEAGITFWKGAGVINDVDDLLKGSETFITNKDANTFIDAFRTITSYKSLQGTSISGLANKKLSKKEIATLALSIKGMADGIANMKKYQDQKKEEKKK